MSDSMKAELEKLMRQTATQRGLEPVVVNADGLDLEDVAKAVTDLVKAGRTAWPHLVSLWLAVVGLAGALGWTWLSPDNVAPQQIAAAVAAYEIASDSPAPPSNPATSEPTAVAGPRLPASLEIEGPSSATPGDLIVLEARGDSEAVRWFLGNSSKTFLPVDGGKRVVFASGTPGEYRFFAVGATVDAGKISLDDDTHTVVIGTPGPAPVPPNPTPTPPPTPVPPAPTPTPTPVPPVPEPTPPPAPIPDTVSSISVVVIRDVGDLTADQAEVLLGLRTWSDLQPSAKVRHYEFAPDQQGPDGERDATVAGYLAKKPLTAKLPYVLLLATDATPAKVLWQGELPATAKELIDLATAKLKPSRPKVSAKE